MKGENIGGPPYPRNAGELEDDLRCEDCRCNQWPVFFGFGGDVKRDFVGYREALLSPRSKRAWWRTKQLERRYHRWEDIPTAFQRDPLYMALRGKRRDLARRWLAREERLSAQRAAAYALLCLSWDTGLLDTILNLAPEGLMVIMGSLLTGRERDMEFQLNTGLPVAAAAVDDLRSLKLLAGRGYRLDFTEEDLKREGWYCWPGWSDTPYGPEDVKSICISASRTGKLDHFARIEEPDALAAAIFCGAHGCTRWLIEQGAPVSRSVRKVLGMNLSFFPQAVRERLIRMRQEALDALWDLRGLSPEEIITPDDIEDFSDPLLLRSLALHPRPKVETVENLITEKVSSGGLRYMIATEKEGHALPAPDSPEGKRIQAWLALIDGDILAEAAARILNDWPADSAGLRGLCGGLGKQLSRSDFPDVKNLPALLTLLDVFELAGPAPSGALSPPAKALFDLLLRADPADLPSFVQMSGAACLLRREDPRVTGIRFAELPSHSKKMLLPFLPPLPPPNYQL